MKKVTSNRMKKDNFRSAESTTIPYVEGYDEKLVPMSFVNKLIERIGYLERVVRTQNDYEKEIQNRQLAIMAENERLKEELTSVRRPDAFGIHGVRYVVIPYSKIEVYSFAEDAVRAANRAQDNGPYGVAFEVTGEWRRKYGERLAERQTVNESTYLKEDGNYGTFETTRH